MFFLTFFWIKIGNIKDCSAIKIAELDGMPGKHIEQKNANKNANKRKISTLTLIFGKMTQLFSQKQIKQFLIT